MFLARRLQYLKFHSAKVSLRTAEDTSSISERSIYDLLMTVMCSDDCDFNICCEANSSE